MEDIDFVQILLFINSALGFILLTGTLILVIIARPHQDTVGQITLVQLIIAVLLCSIAGILSFISVITDNSDGLCQKVGFITNLSSLLFSFSVAYRYFYFFWYVVLERQIRIFRWIAVSIFVWTLVIGFSLYQGLTKQYIPRLYVHHCTSPFYLNDPIPKLNASMYIIFMVIGGIAHTFFGLFIIFKSKSLLRTNSTYSRPTSNQTMISPPRRKEPLLPKSTRRAIFGKFIPVSVCYLATHLPFIILVMRETLHHIPMPHYAELAYFLLHSSATWITTIVVIFTNQCLVATLKHYLGLSP